MGGGIEMSTTVLPFTLTIITIYYSDTINTLKLEIKHFTIITTSIVTQSNYFNFKFFSIHCLGLFESCDSIKDIQRRTN